MIFEKIFDFYKNRIDNSTKHSPASPQKEKPDEKLTLQLLKLTEADNDVLITIVGIGHYFGSKPFQEGKTIILKRDRGNKYDEKAIMAVDYELNTLGYVANSSYTVKDGTLSAKVIYGGIRSDCVARVLWASDIFVICKLEGISCFDLVYRQGVRLCDKGEHETALRLFLALEPKRPYAEIFKRIADCYIKLEDYESALPFVEKTLQKDGKDLQALMMRGIVYKAQGRLKDAIADFSVINTMQENERVLLERCKCYILLENYDAAFCDVENVLRLNPKRREAQAVKEEILKYK